MSFRLGLIVTPGLSRFIELLIPRLVTMIHYFRVRNQDDLAAHDSYVCHY